MDCSLKILDSLDFTLECTLLSPVPNAGTRKNGTWEDQNLLWNKFILTQLQLVMPTNSIGKNGELKLLLIKMELSLDRMLKLGTLLKTHNMTKYQSVLH